MFIYCVKNVAKGHWLKAAVGILLLSVALYLNFRLRNYDIRLKIVNILDGTHKYVVGIITLKYILIMQYRLVADRKLMAHFMNGFTYIRRKRRWITQNSP